jgi:hypothetical protein
MIALGGCGSRESDITIAYRGDVSAYRPLVHVRYTTRDGHHVVVAPFPSAARAEPVATSGTLELVVTVQRDSGPLLARDSLAPRPLTPRMSYGVNVAVSARRPPASRCSGDWRATPLPPPARESLYVSVTAYERGNPPRCDD